MWEEQVVAASNANVDIFHVSLNVITIDQK
jgi:hypothetical protein